MPLSDDDLRAILHPPDLRSELRTLVAAIPPGRVASFGDLAEALGDVKAARWIARELQEFDADEFPVHRVIRRTGEIIETARLPLNVRLDRLRAERIAIIGGKIDLHEFGTKLAVDSQPLKCLQEIQDRIALAVDPAPLKLLPKRIAGVDVSYSSDRQAVAAYVVVDAASGELLHHELLSDEAAFPYISGYLAFREIPLYAKLLEIVRNSGRWEPFVMVDGNGILHPRRAGIATMLGLVAGVRTVGVGKHLLCGQVVEAGDAPAEIRAGDGSLLGFRLRRGSNRSTLYVSPGNGVDADGALRLVQSQIHDRRLPAPIFHADRLSRAAARNRRLHS